jgi:hypothetical protein
LSFGEKYEKGEKEGIVKVKVRKRKVKEKCKVGKIYAKEEKSRLE